MKPRNALLLLVVALAAFLRFYRLGASSLWVDEGGTVALAQMPLGRFWDTVSRYEANMSLYYGIMRGFVLLGQSESFLRGLSVLFGLAAVVAVYDAGRRMRGVRAGLLGATLLSVNTLHIWFSQEARSYPLLVLLVALSLSFFFQASEAPGVRRTWVLYVTSSVLAVYAHFFAAFVPPSHWLALGGKRLRAIGRPRLAAIALGLLIPLSPLGAFVLWRDQGQIDWVAPISRSSVWLSYRGLCGFNPLMYPLPLIGLLLVLLDLRKDAESAWRARLLGSSLAFPLVAVGLLSLVKPMFFFRYFGICLPPTVLLSAFVLAPASEPPRATRVLLDVAAAIVLSSGLWSATGSYSRLANRGGDWRSATEYVLRNRKEGDGILFYVSAGRDVYEYYRTRVPSSRLPLPFPEVVFPAEGEIASAHLTPDYPRLRQPLGSHRRIWVVLHQKEVAALPPEVLQHLRLQHSEEFTPEPVRAGMNLTVALCETADSP